MKNTSAILVFICLLTFGCDESSSGSSTVDAMAFTDAAPMDQSVSDGFTVDSGGGDQSCGEPIELGPDETCRITEGSNGSMVLVGSVLLPNGILSRGSVYVVDGRIACVGCDCADEMGFDMATRIDCADAVISPGLINPHDHLTFTEGTPIDHGETRYDHRHEWRQALSTPSNAHGTGADSSGNRWGELRMLFSGVTGYVGSGKANGLIRNLDRLDDAERALGFKQVTFQTFSLGDANRRFRANCGWDYRYDEYEVSQFEAFIPHVAEGIDEYAQEEFRCQSTSFDNGQDFTEKNTAHIHSIGLNAADYWSMVQDGTKLIWSPRSNISLYGTTAEVQTFHRFGGTLALSTDWTYSGSANMLRELACASAWNTAYLDNYFTDRDLWLMATLDAARATANEHIIGSLEQGKLADITVFAGDRTSGYRAVIDAGNQDVLLVLRGGEALFGRSALVSALRTCETMDVCGQAYMICAQDEFGTSFATIERDVNGGNAAYPAIFCDSEPPSEPTCIPSRPGEFSGLPTENDLDGDGINNDDDNCPRVFNPRLPYKGNTQGDADNDGLGDACDDSPLPSDLDGDAVANEDDNCPLEANPDQTDSDMDRRGDACDFCPEAPNPESVCLPAAGQPATIAEIQRGEISEGTRVFIPEAVVTAVWDRGIWVQSGSGEYAGVAVFLGNGDTPHEIGDVISIDADVQEYFDDTQLSEAIVTSLGMSVEPIVTEVSVADALEEAYEGVLVRLIDAVPGDLNYSCAADNENCSDEALWTVRGQGDSNDEIIVFDRSYGSDDWADNIGSVPVTGVMTYRFDRRRIMPRTSSDFGGGQ